MGRLRSRADKTAPAFLRGGSRRFVCGMLPRVPLTAADESRNGASLFARAGGFPYDRSMGTESRHVGRRAVVRTGIASAWATPIVLVSVPAYAAVCSPGAPKLTLKALNGLNVGVLDNDG